jgi:hypothetical protein
MSASAHKLMPHICPVCWKRFDARHQLRSHQAQRGHRLEKEMMARQLLRKFRAYDHEKRSKK